MTTTEPTRLRGSVVALFALVTGIAAGTLYFGQPLVEQFRQDLSISEGAATLVISLTQVGYVAGLVLVVPLGDRVDRRRILALLLLALTLVQIGVALSPTIVVLDVAVVLLGITACVAQLTVATAAGMAPEDSRGKVVGTVMSGLLLGILLARTVSGALAELGGWRTPYFVGAGLVAVTGALVLVVVPSSTPRREGSYLALIRSLGTLFAREPVLRLRAALGAALFAAFSALWTPLGFLLSGAPYGYSTAVIGLFGLIGAAGAITASVVGRLTDRLSPTLLTRVTAAGLLVSWLPLWFGRSSLWVLILGVVLLDLATAGLHITNQSQVYRLDPAARSRLTAAYMSTYFLGGVIGSTAAGLAWTAAGWTGVSIVGAACGLVAVVLSWAAMRTR
jgi:predicted MFS family arabinose efflux permease